MVSFEGGVVKKGVGEKDINVLDRGNKRKMQSSRLDTISTVNPSLPQL